MNIDIEGVATRPCWEPCDYAHDEADTPDHAALTASLLVCPECGWTAISTGYIEAGPGSASRESDGTWKVECRNPSCGSHLYLWPARGK